MPEPDKIQRMAFHLYQTAWAGLDWIYPPLCGGCGKAGERWCRDCQTHTERITENVCIHCGDVISISGICYKCRNSPPSYTSLRSWAIFSGPLRNAIHRLKYKGDIALGEILARPLIEIVYSLSSEIDAVVPVPIGIARKTERGYNQAAILGFPIALGCGIPFRPGWLVKIRETRSQVGLTHSERQENLREAFRANAESVIGKRILIVDDVVTSGATMKACSAALLEGGAAEIYGLSLARSGHPDYWMTEGKIFW